MLLLLVVWALMWALLQIVDMLPHPETRQIIRAVLLVVFAVWLLWAFILGGTATLRAG